MALANVAGSAMTALATRLSSSRSAAWNIDRDALGRLIEGQHNGEEATNTSAAGEIPASIQGDDGKPVP